MQLTLRDVARALSVSERDVLRWVDGDALPAYHVGGQFLFNRAELVEWAAARGRALAEEILQGALSAAVPSLADALAAGGVVHGLPGSDRSAVLRNLARALPLPAAVDREELERVLLAREALSSTALGRGIAVPHARNPLIVSVPQPIVPLYYLETPVDFGAPDGQPVHALFALIAPTVRAHLHLLSRLARALRQPSFREAVDRRADREEILSAVRGVETPERRP